MTKNPPSTTSRAPQAATAEAAAVARAYLPAWWPEALLDGLCLALFMLSAAGFCALLEGTGSPVRAAIASPTLRRTLMGLAMGATAMALIHSPFGKRSGAHFNPATTLTFARLGRVGFGMTVGYVLAQFAGGVAGLALARALFGPVVASPEVHWVVTRPGAFGLLWAFLAETTMTFALMSIVLRVSQSRWNRHTAACVAILVATYITLAAPISGMSMNPARTFASAFLAGDLSHFWLYATAPLLGMLLAAEWFVRAHGGPAIRCAKLHHENGARCMFRCRWG